MRTVIVGIIAALTLTGCSMADTAAAPPGAGTAPTTTPSATEEPHTEAGVRAAALDEFDSFASGDYGSTWDRYYGAAKKAISRAEYVRLLKLCPDPAAGVRFQIEKVSMDGDRAARVRVSRLGIAIMSYRFVYESGRWAFVPDPAAMRDYRTKTVQQMVKAQRATGGCGS